MDAVSTIFGQETLDNRQKAAMIAQATFARKPHPGMKPNPAQASPQAIAPAPFADWNQYRGWQTGQHRVEAFHVGTGHIMNIFGI